MLWRSGYAAVCKTAYTGSIPVGTSKIEILEDPPSGGGSEKKTSFSFHSPSTTVWHLHFS